MFKGKVRVALIGLLVLFINGFWVQGAIGQTLENSRLVALAVPTPTGVSSSVLTGSTNPDQPLQLGIALPLANEAGLRQFVNSVSDPKSPNYRHFITPEEVGNRFGASDSDVQQVVNYLKDNGMNVTLVAKNHISILADASVAQAESAFHTSFNSYRIVGPDEKGDSSRFSFDSKLEVPGYLAHLITDVEGVENFIRPHHNALTPDQTRTLYSEASLYNGGDTGLGRTVGISNYDTYDLSNIPLFYAHFNLPTPAGGVGSNIVIKGSDMNSAPGDPEGNLDMQMVAGMAPLATIDVYNGFSPFGVLTQEGNDNLVDIVTDSWGWSVSNISANAYNSLHLSMSAQGITYMAATGDSGTTIAPWIYPNIDPEVLQVGGTAPSVDGSGNRTAEPGWNGSGGGWIADSSLDINRLPSWLVATGAPTNINYRLNPDIGLVSTGNEFYQGNSLASGYAGTSFASPIFAGGLAVAEQEIINHGGLPADGNGKQRFGRIQDLFYAQNMRSDVWYDVTSGCNGNLPDSTQSCAGAGWDFVTGLGAINFQAFVDSQVGTDPDFTIGGSPASRTIAKGSVTTYTVTTSALNGFTADTALTISGVPANTTAAFSPTTITGGAGTSTLTITTTSSTPTATSNLVITGTSGSLVHTTTVGLTVTGTPDFSISAAPSSRTVTQGGATTYTVTTSALNGFTADTALTISGVPANTTTGFSPTPITGGAGTSTLTVTTSGTTPTGTHTLTITGTSSSLVHTTTVDLIVNAPDFTIGASPSSRTVVQGSPATYTVTLSAINGFSANTDLTISGVPANASASFSPSTVTGGAGTSTLTVTTTSTTTTGSHTLTITGTSGSLVHTTTVDMTVNAPPDFSLSASPSTRGVNQGGATPYTVTVNGLNGFTADTALTLSGLPANTTGSFSSSTITSGSGSSTLTVTTTAASQTGSYSLTITATSGSLVHTSLVSLDINVAPTPSPSPTPTPTPTPTPKAHATPNPTPPPPSSTPTPTPEPTSVADITLNSYPEYATSGKALELPLAQTIYFLVGSEHHKIVVKEIGDGYVILTISSTPFDTKIVAGQALEYDVNQDKQDDIHIAYSGLKDGQANLTFRAIEAEAATPVQTVAPAATTSGGHPLNLRWIYYATGALIVFAGGTTLFFLRRRRYLPTAL